MGSRAQALRDYPNLNNRKLPWLIGCVHEVEPDEAKQGFMRTCFKNVKIADIQPMKSNRQPSCIWRVYYQMKDPTPDFSDDGNSGKDVLYPLSDDEQQLKKLFIDVTSKSHIVGMNVGQKYYSQNRSHAIVDYSPVDCSCPVQDLKAAAEEPRMRPSITEVEIDLYCMKL